MNANERRTDRKACREPVARFPISLGMMYFVANRLAFKLVHTSSSHRLSLSPVVSNNLLLCWRGTENADNDEVRESQQSSRSVGACEALPDGSLAYRGDRQAYYCSLVEAFAQSCGDVPVLETAQCTYMHLEKKSSKSVQLSVISSGCRRRDN